MDGGFEVDLAKMEACAQTFGTAVNNALQPTQPGGLAKDFQDRSDQFKTPPAISESDFGGLPAAQAYCADIKKFAKMVSDELSYAATVLDTTSRGLTSTKKMLQSQEEANARRFTHG